MERLGLRAGDIEAVVPSHGHFDHTGGLEGLAELRGRDAELPTISRQAVEDEGL